MTIAAATARRSRTTLALRVGRGVTLVLLILMPVFGFIGYRISRSIVIDQIIHRQQVATAAAMATINRRVAEAEHDILLIAEDGTTERWLESRAPAADRRQRV